MLLKLLSLTAAQLITVSATIILNKIYSEGTNVYSLRHLSLTGVDSLLVKEGSGMSFPKIII
jgi:hypothetical protein